MKKTALALLTAFTLTTTGVAFAGGTVPEAPAPVEAPAAPAPAPIVAPAPAVVAPVAVHTVAPQGWWVPLMAVALVAVAAGGEHH